MKVASREKMIEVMARHGMEYDDDYRIAIKPTDKNNLTEEIKEVIDRESMIFDIKRHTIVDSATRKSYLIGKNSSGLSYHFSRKLEILRKYPYFEEDIKRIRIVTRIAVKEEIKIVEKEETKGEKENKENERKYKEDEKKNKEKYKQEVDASIKGKVRRYIDWHKAMLFTNDELYKGIEIIFSMDKRLNKFRQINFPIICYYIIFNSIIPANTLGTLFIESPYEKDGLYNHADKIVNHLMENDALNSIVIETRNKMSLLENDCIENIGINYTLYYHRIFNYLIYYRSRHRLLREIYNLIESYEFLNLESDVDYQLMLFYIITRRSPTDDEYIKYFCKSNTKIFKGKELYNNRNINLNSVYVEYPFYTNKDFITSSSTWITKKIEKMYKINGKWAKNIPVDYYFRKHVVNEFDTLEKYNLSNNIHQTKNQMYLEIYKKLEGTYKDKLEIEGDRDPNKIKYIIREYYETQKEFQKGFKLR